MTVNWGKYVCVYGDVICSSFWCTVSPWLELGEPMHMTAVSHQLACAFAKAVEEYMTKEKQRVAILGQFPDIHVEGCHISPLMSRPKVGGKRLIIVELSFKEGFG